MNKLFISVLIVSLLITLPACASPSQNTDDATNNDVRQPPELPSTSEQQGQDTTTDTTESEENSDETQPPSLPS